MKAAVLQKYGQFEWKTINKPEPGDHEVLIKVSYAGICGSDQHIFRGEFVPRTKVPFVPGHEFAGIVVDTGKKVSRVAIGDQVAVDPIIWCGKCPACKLKHYPACVSLKLIGVDMNGGFGEYINVPEDSLYIVDHKIPPRQAALVEVLSIGFHACNRAGVKPDGTVVIWGAGKVGQSILQAVRTKTSNTLILVDILDQRLALAKKYYPGIHTINARNEDPVKRIMTITGNEGVDVAFEAIGHFEEMENRDNPVRNCISSIRGAGIICVLGLGNEPVPLLMKELIWKEAKIVASRVSHGEFTETIAHLEKGQLQPDALISGIIHPQDIQKAFQLLESEPANHLKILLDFTAI